VPVDNVAPTISSSSPADGATKVSVLSDIQVTFSENLGATAANASSESLAATTVNSFTVTLTYKNPQGADNIRGTASYDSTTRTLTFSPLRPLDWDTEYKLTITGVKDSAGNTMSDTTLSFTTYINPSLLEIFYALGSMASYIESTYDGNGHLTRDVSYSGPGPDGIWFNADDEVNFYDMPTYDGNGNRIRDVWYSGFGADNTWFTADDVVEHEFQYETSL
jgi:hypothetical protein